MKKTRRPHQRPRMILPYRFPETPLVQTRTLSPFPLPAQEVRRSPHQLLGQRLLVMTLGYMVRILTGFEAW